MVRNTGKSERMDRDNNMDWGMHTDTDRMDNHNRTYLHGHGPNDVRGNGDRGAFCGILLGVYIIPICYMIFQKKLKHATRVHTIQYTVVTKNTKTMNCGKSTNIAIVFTNNTKTVNCGKSTKSTIVITKDA